MPNNLLQTIENDAKVVIADVQNGLNWLKDEGEKVIAWADKDIPGAQAAISAFLQDAESAAGNLATQAETGFGAVVQAMVPDLETTAANAISAMAIGKSAQGTLTALDAAGVATLAGIIESAGKVALTTVLAKLAPQSQQASGS